MSVTITNLDRLRWKLGQLNPAEKKAVGVAIKTAALNVQNGAKRRVPVDRGTLRNHITHEMSADNLSAVAGVMGGEGTLEVIAKSVEFGARPHWPPLAPIQAWVRRKKLAGSYSIKSHRRVGGRAATDAEDRAVAFLIARKISREGTPERPYLFPAFEEERPKIVPRIARAIMKAHQEVASK